MFRPASAPYPWARANRGASSLPRVALACPSRSRRLSLDDFEINPARRRARAREPREQAATPRLPVVARGHEADIDRAAVGTTSDLIRRNGCAAKREAVRFNRVLVPAFAIRVGVIRKADTEELAVAVDDVVAVRGDYVGSLRSVDRLGRRGAPDHEYEQGDECAHDELDACAFECSTICVSDHPCTAVVNSCSPPVRVSFQNGWNVPGTLATTPW
jgi:hypothetical protein